MLGVCTYPKWRLTCILQAELSGGVPHCAAVEPKVLLLSEVDHQQAAHHQQAGTRRPGVEEGKPQLTSTVLTVKIHLFDAR